eukprot:2839472-Pyramimonas_sp.AAC.2
MRGANVQNAVFPTLRTSKIPTSKLRVQRMGSLDESKSRTKRRCTTWDCRGSVRVSLLGSDDSQGPGFRREQGSPPGVDRESKGSRWRAVNGVSTEARRGESLGPGGLRRAPEGSGGLRRQGAKAVTSRFVRIGRLRGLPGCVQDARWYGRRVGWRGTHRHLLDDKIGGSVSAYLGGVEEVVHNVQEPQPAGLDQSHQLHLAPGAPRRRLNDEQQKQFANDDDYDVTNETDRRRQPRFALAL